MWSPAPSTFIVKSTKAKVVTEDDKLFLDVRCKVQNIPKGAKTELWLYPSSTGLGKDAPAAWRATHPDIQVIDDKSSWVSYSFPFKKSDYGKTFTPVVGSKTDGNSGSAFRVLP